MGIIRREKIKDLIVATKQELVSASLESDYFSRILGSLSEAVVSEESAMLISGILGAIAPVFNDIKLSYKQNRFERHVREMFEIVNIRIDDLEVRFEELTEEIREKFRTTYAEWLLDSFQDEKQDGKIPCYINGYINLMNNDANDNLMLMFFNTANELTCLDVDVLRMYSSNSEGNILTLCDKYNLIPEQTMVIKEKLARLGLLQSNNDEIRDNNLDYIVSYLEDQDYARRHKSQKDIRLSKTKIKKVNRADSFHITNLGESFLKTVSD